MTSAAEEITAAARTWLDSLDERQRAQATFPLGSSERFAWAYTPGPREGLALRDMRPQQRAASGAVVAATMSARTAGEIASIIDLEPILGQIEQSNGRGGWMRRDEELYWFAVFGAPSESAPWAWRVEGHHVSIHVAMLGDRVVGFTPSFLGSNPAVIPAGYPGAGTRALTGEETLARELLRALKPDERGAAVISHRAPADILSGIGRVADLRQIQGGVRRGDLGGERRISLERLIRHYVDRMRPDVADAAWARIAADGFDDATFAWAGGDQPGQAHYYAVRGPGFVIEYDNTQNGANHIHSVFRDLEHDWGDDEFGVHLAWAHGDR